MYRIKGRNLIGAVLISQAALFGAPALAETKTDVTISHYFTGELGLGGLKEIFAYMSTKTVAKFTKSE